MRNPAAVRALPVAEAPARAVTALGAGQQSRTRWRRHGRLWGRGHRHDIKVGAAQGAEADTSARATQGAEDAKAAWHQQGGAAGRLKQAPRMAVRSARTKRSKRASAQMRPRGGWVQWLLCKEGAGVDIPPPAPAPQRHKAEQRRTQTDRPREDRTSPRRRPVLELPQ